MARNIALFVARHGRTVLNDEGKFRGDADPELDANGFRDANELAFWFQPIELSFIVCSDKKRAVTTASIISLQKQLGDTCGFDLTPKPNELLRSWRIGDFSGKPKDKENLDELQQYLDDPSLAVPGGESLNAFAARVRPLFLEAVDYAIECGVPGLIVVHSSTVHEVGTMLCKNHTAALVKPGGVAAVYIENGVLGAEAIFKPMAADPKLSQYI
jgi:probable phosphoglycerate mutase